MVVKKLESRQTISADVRSADADYVRQDSDTSMLKEEDSPVEIKRDSSFAKLSLKKKMMRVQQSLSVDVGSLASPRDKASIIPITELNQVS